jgi:hypothetical protein
MVTDGLQQAQAERAVHLDDRSDDAVGQNETGFAGVRASCD